jgi:two-component system, sensor histidine kinase and response regulator
MSYQNNDLQVIEKIKHQLEASESELKEKQAHFNLITLPLIEQLETLTGFFQIMYNNSNSLTPAEIKEFASRMDIAVKNIIITAGNILEWDKIQKGLIKTKPQEIDLQNAMLENIYFFKHIAAKKNITVVSIIDPKIKVKADREHFDYIIRNLISNGIKFTPEGGNVDIFTMEAGELLRIIIEDDGMGISDKVMDLLFDSDTHYTSPGTNNERGNGYGLYTVKKLVELQGGRIRIDSEQNHGTKVSFTLPLVKEEEAE